ncbi:hypothetical protein EV360DRAFT_53206 [Lentinula raphanica]|nr:hypothetical protein EV360DRAFT_53206 [Lentinula raphanica]
MLSRCSVQLQRVQKTLNTPSSSRLGPRLLIAPLPLTTHRYSSSNASSKQTPAASTLGVKELVQRDIRHAEKLGVLEPAPADATGFRRLVHSAIQLGKFYFRGAKLIYTRGREVTAIKARVRAGGLPMTRAESRLINLQRRDVIKLMPFIVMAIVVEELIPVAAIYAPFMLPSTCILPGQRSRIEEKKTQRAIASATKAQSIFAIIRKDAIDGTLPFSALRGTGSAALACSLLRLPTFGNDLLRTWRIRRHLHFIQNDDRLLISEKSVDSLSDQDVAQALEERGLYVYLHFAVTSTEIIVGSIIGDIPAEVQRARLKWWLDSVQSTPDDATLTRRLFLLMEQKS